MLRNQEGGWVDSQIHNSKVIQSYFQDIYQAQAFYSPDTPQRDESIDLVFREMHLP